MSQTSTSTTLVKIRLGNGPVVEQPAGSLRFWLKKGYTQVEAGAEATADDLPQTPVVDVPTSTTDASTGADATASGDADSTPNAKAPRFGRQGN